MYKMVNIINTALFIYESSYESNPKSFIIKKPESAGHLLKSTPSKTMRHLRTSQKEKW